MSETAVPAQSAVDWQQVRDEWLAAIHHLYADIEHWAEQRGWATLRDDRTIIETGFGTYAAPVLLVHTPQGRVLFSPFGHRVYGAEGVIELVQYPTFDGDLRLARRNGNWVLERPDSSKLGQPWTEEVFGRAVQQLLAQ